MKARLGVLALVIVAAGLAAQPFAQAPVRLSDKQLKQTIADTREAVNRFTGKMDSQMRTAVLKGPDYEVDVKAYLKDLEDMGKQVSNRFSPPDYSAGTEALAYLKKLKAFDRGLAIRPGMSGADKYWDDAKPLFARLSFAYGIDWNSDPANWKGRRVSDGEVARNAGDIKKLAGTLRKSVDSALKADRSMDKAVRAGLVADVKGIETAANDFGNTFKGGRDASPALSRLSDAVYKVGGAVPPAVLAGPAGATFETIKTKLSVLNNAYGR